MSRIMSRITSRSEDEIRITVRPKSANGNADITLSLNPHLCLIMFMTTEIGSWTLPEGLKTSILEDQSWDDPLAPSIDTAQS